MTSADSPTGRIYSTFPPRRQRLPAEAAHAHHRGRLQPDPSIRRPAASRADSLEAGRHALIRSLAELPKRSADTGSPSSSTAGREARRWRSGTLPAGWTIIYSRLGEKADEVIKRLRRDGERGDPGRHLRPGDRHVCRPPREELHRLRPNSPRGSTGSPLRPSPDADTPAEVEEDETDRPGAAKKKGPARRLSKQKRAALARIRKL